MVINSSNIVSFVFFGVSCLLLLATIYNKNPYSSYKSDEPEWSENLEKSVAPVTTPVTPEVPAAKPHQSDKSHKPRYVFVDLGANKGDSLETFLGHDKAKFAFDFPRPEWATHDQAGGSSLLPF